MASIDKKVNPDAAVDPAVLAAIASRLEDGLLPCAAACALAEELALPPAVIGATADARRIPLTACQLGLFGYPGHAKGWEAAGVTALPVPEALTAALLAARDEVGGVTCLAAWRAADASGCTRMQAGCAAERLGVKVRACQLGAF